MTSNQEVMRLRVSELFRYYYPNPHAIKENINVLGKIMGVWNVIFLLSIIIFHPHSRKEYKHHTKISMAVGETCFALFAWSWSVIKYSDPDQGCPFSDIASSCYSIINHDLQKYNTVRLFFKKYYSSVPSQIPVFFGHFKMSTSIITVVGLARFAG